MRERLSHCSSRLLVNLCGRNCVPVIVEDALGAWSMELELSYDVGDWHGEVRSIHQHAINEDPWSELPERQNSMDLSQ